MFPFQLPAFGEECIVYVRAASPSCRCKTLCGCVICSCFWSYFAPFQMLISDHIPSGSLASYIWAYLFWHSAGVLGDKSDAYCCSPSVLLAHLPWSRSSHIPAGVRWSQKSVPYVAEDKWISVNLYLLVDHWSISHIGLR
jgi:hypothetical protein